MEGKGIKSTQKFALTSAFNVGPVGAFIMDTSAVRELVKLSSICMT